MREIKFRAWDVKRKKFNFMDLRDAISSDDAYALCGSQGTDWAEDRENSCTMSCKCKLQQFTGLKDKNGKEIYEGDIVFGEDLGGVICWNKDYVQFMIVDEANRENYCFEHDFELKEIKVMGNIYENPTMLSDALEKNNEGGGQ